MTVSDAPSCGITYNHHSDNARCVIYNSNIYVTQATNVLAISNGTIINKYVHHL